MNVHSIILVICSAIGFTGHYLQFGVARFTPWIPATVGLSVFLFHLWFKNAKGILKYLPILVVIVFGIITTNMSIRFLPEECEPLRKKIIFSIMTLSAWVTIAYYIIAVLKTKRTQTDN